MTATSCEPAAFWKPGPLLTSQTSPQPMAPQRMVFIAGHGMPDEVAAQTVASRRSHTLSRTLSRLRNPPLAVLRLIGFLVIVAVAISELGLLRLLRGRLPVGARAGLVASLDRAGAALVRHPAPRRGPPAGLRAAGQQPPRLSGHIRAVGHRPDRVRLQRRRERWPIAGLLSKLAGTVFIDRARRSDVVRVGQRLVPLIQSGQVVALFLEGTSTGGDRVLPFHSSLLAPAVRERWTITPAFVAYAAPAPRSSASCATGATPSSSPTS